MEGVTSLVATKEWEKCQNPNFTTLASEAAIMMQSTQ